MSQQINLFNPIFRQQKKYFSAVAMAKALGLILLGSLLVSAYAGYRLTALKAQAAAMNESLNAAQAQFAKVNAEYPPRQKDSGLEAAIQNAEVELGALRRVADILQKGELGNTEGYADYLRAFARQIVPGVWLTGFHIQGAGAEIALQGRALNPEMVPAYIGKLKSEPVLQGKSFSMLEMHQSPMPAASRSEVPSPMTAPGYIEFRLQSSGIASQSGDGTGVTGK